MDVESLECPVSLVTSESQRFLANFYAGERVRKATGGVLYGPDSSKWSARWFDAVDVIQAEIQRIDSAFHKALRSKQRG